LAGIDLNKTRSRHVMDAVVILSTRPGGFSLAQVAALAKAGLVKTLFDRFNGHLDAKGYIARGGQIVDATIVNAPKQHNTRGENEAIKAGKTPEGWDEKPAKNAQKDKDARWTKKNEESFYGYKNHVSVDRKHKIIRRYAETDASVHDSQKLDEVLDKANTSNEVWADSAYRSAEAEAKLKEKGYQSRIHRRGARNHPLSERQKAATTTRSRVRARVEAGSPYQGVASLHGQSVRRPAHVRLPHPARQGLQTAACLCRASFWSSTQSPSPCRSTLGPAPR
jgi:IS5 family transposase